LTGDVLITPTIPHIVAFHPKKSASRGQMPAQLLRQQRLEFLDPIRQQHALRASCHQGAWSSPVNPAMTTNTSRINTPRNTPNTAPSVRSTGRRPMASTSFLPNQAKNPQANTVTMNTSMNPAA
jgi:hypothetical protein